MRTDRGILFAATGKRYVEEALQSAGTYRAMMPKIPIGIFTRDTSAAHGRAFDFVDRLPAGPNSFLDKILAIERSPFLATLFVDTDTRCIAPCPELFDVADRWDIAAAHAPVRVHQHDPAHVPDCFPEFNTGVIVLRMCGPVIRFAETWKMKHMRNIHRLGERTSDQPAFREALYESDLRILTLTPEYNLRAVFPCFVGGNAAVKIIHGRGRRPDRVGEALEKQKRTKWPRLFG